MSSFGDGNIKTRIESELSYLAKEYADNFYDNLEAQRQVQRQFLIDVLRVLRYICGEY